VLEEVGESMARLLGGEKEVSSEWNI
jgi:hypothetical protein